MFVQMLRIHRYKPKNEKKGTKQYRDNTQFRIMDFSWFGLVCFGLIMILFFGLGSIAVSS